MNAEGTKTWAEATTRWRRSQRRQVATGKQVAIVLDGVVQSAPTVNEPITGGQTAISGKFTADEAKHLKTVLETGALPVTLESSSTRVVGPTLGPGLAAAGRARGARRPRARGALPGRLLPRARRRLTWSRCSVFASIFLGVLAVLSQLGLFALSLPGIAGIVLTIGLAADSSILIIERVQGRGRAWARRTARRPTSGTRHAIGTSVDADLVTFVSALVLFVVAIGPVRGLRAHAHDRHRVRPRS